MSRLDQALVERGLVTSRSRARAITLGGMVRIDGRTETRPSCVVEIAADISIDAAAGIEWVSRGALKLIAALDHFGIDPAGRVALDIGASTGGFTQVLLGRGAARIYAVDVGHGQLAARLREEERIVVLEQLNARELTRHQIPEPVSLITCDASFIGLEKILPAPLALAESGADLIALIKPQFEVGRAAIGKGGIVRDPVERRAACDRIEAWLNGVEGWRVRGIVDSPILGGSGNHEFLLCASRA